MDFFKQASNYKILVLIDACHSSGMVRSNAGQSLSYRSSGFWNIRGISRLPKSDEGKHHSHVTLITAVNKDKLQVPETVLNNKYHGALSWFFAQAISGKADGNQNGRLERDELDHFLSQKVSTHMNKVQNPKLLPQNDQEISVFKLAPAPQSPKPKTSPLIPRYSHQCHWRRGGQPQGIAPTPAPTKNNVSCRGNPLWLPLT
ncbi:hypothetical protein PN36_23970 [Candidatus Thiomargarita nelsonii]|uniref:Peptidase C14 caspase catalytic subunit p20 n=1 Tax=Candidatus Thiomargarita nelsonii TaxID=1003181 RepID=A0A4E0QTE4_9GAMM|nr:hypothetical protein PN36_23970 [Candidatus Thiomargarita nelsonii]